MKLQISIAAPAAHDQLIQVIAACIRADLEAGIPDMNSCRIVHTSEFTESYDALVEAVGHPRALRLFRRQIEAAPGEVLAAVLAAVKKVKKLAKGTKKISQTRPPTRRVILPDLSGSNGPICIQSVSTYRQVGRALASEVWP